MVSSKKTIIPKQRKTHKTTTKHKRKVHVLEQLMDKPSELEGQAKELDGVQSKRYIPSPARRRQNHNVLP